MVCKSCGAQGMQGVTFISTEEGFQIWCFTAGTIENLVSHLVIPDNCSSSSFACHSLVSSLCLGEDYLNWLCQLQLEASEYSVWKHACQAGY